jgi:hypothetical protein
MRLNVQRSGSRRNASSSVKRKKIFFGVRNAAKELHVSERHFRRLAETYDVEPIEIGHAFFYLAKQIDEMKATHAAFKRVRRRHSEIYL